MVIFLNNGFKTGDWHLIKFDIYHEQPPQEKGGVFGLNIGLMGFVLGFMVHYDKQ
jgi:hypothetical protein